LSMPMPDHIEAAVAALDPAAQAVVRMVWHLHEEQMVELRAFREEAAKRDAETAALKAQVETYKKMLFGRRTEKLPPISSEVRKAVEAEDFPLELASTATADELKAAQTTARRKRGRKDSEDKRERTKKSLAKLPIVREEVLVRHDQLPDGMSRDAFGVLGIEVVRRIEHVREHLVMVEYHLEKLAERNGDLIIQGEAPLNVVDGGAWGQTDRRIRPRVMISDPAAGRPEAPRAGDRGKRSADPALSGGRPGLRVLALAARR
jgi:hypothetical protein